MSDAPAWSLHPISAEVTKDGVKCAFYVLNDTGEALTRLENLSITLAARSRGNVIARGSFGRVRVNARKGRCAVVKLTLSATEELAGCVLSEDKLFFDINRGEAAAASMKGARYPFAATAFPTVEVPAATVTLSATEATLRANETLSLSAAVAPENADCADVIWTTNDATVATVRDGVVTARFTGIATIAAVSTDNPQCYDTCEVIVVNGGLTSSEMEVDLAAGAEKALTISDESDAGKIKCVSSDPNVAADSVGKRCGRSVPLTVSAKSPGAAVLTVTNQKTGDSVDIRVNVSAAAGDGTVNYRALIVTEVNFNSVSPIASAETDMALLEQMFDSVTGPEGGKYAVTKKTDLSKQGFLDAIAETFAGADEDDVSLLYIDTYGDYYATGDDAGRMAMRAPDGGLELLRLGELADALKAVPGRIVLMVDTSNSGAGLYDPDVEQNGAIAANAAQADIERAAAAFDGAVIRAFRKADPGIAVRDGIASNTGEYRVENKFYVLTASRYQESSFRTSKFGFFA